MRYRHIPHSDLRPSILALGTHGFGTSIDTSTAFRLLDAFVAVGGNFIDTAHVYGAWVPDGIGLSERAIGQWLNERSIRSQIIIGTKGAHPLLSSMQTPRLSSEEIASDLEESLRCLHMETIDLFWLHRDDPGQPVADIFEALQQHVRSGKIRYFGCSNWRMERLEEAMQYALTHQMTEFVGNQVMWSLAVPNLDAMTDASMVVMDERMRAFHQNNQLAIVAYSAQAKGFFTKAQWGDAALPDHLRQVYENDENTERLRRAQHVARDMGLPLSVVSLAYLTNQPLLTFPIFGCTTVQQLQENVQAGNIELDPEIVCYLESG